MTSPKPEPRRRTTLADVAERAGVSATTASFVLNNRPAGISKSTQSKVLRAAEDLQYRANAAAKALLSRTTDSLALITDEIASTPYAGEIIRGAQEMAWAKGQVLLVVNTNGDAGVEHAAVEMMLDRQVEGIIFASMHTREAQLPKGLGQVPAVLVNCFAGPSAEFQPSAILPDDEVAGRVAAQILLDAGHRRIAMINGDEDTYAWVCRRNGYVAALADAGHAVDPELIVEGNWHSDGGYDLTHRLFALPEPPTALFCANDRTAHGAYDALRELGHCVPGDVSVVGFDDQELSRYLRPALTTLALPHYELGRRGCEVLLNGEWMSRTRELVPCPPRIRQSVAACP